MTKQEMRPLLTAKGAALILILLQLLVKFYVEIPKAYEFSVRLPVRETVWVLTAAWLILVPLYIAGNKGAFLAGTILGILHGVLALYMPVSGTCDHYVIGSIVSVHGLLIAYLSYKAYRSMSAAALVDTGGS